jgi:hypothetical protein
LLSCALVIVISVTASARPPCGRRVFLYICTKNTK